MHSHLARHNRLSWSTARGRPGRYVIVTRPSGVGQSLRLRRRSHETARDAPRVRAASAVPRLIAASVRSRRRPARSAHLRRQPRRRRSARTAPYRPPLPDAALVQKYCVTCHSDRAKTGGLSLEGIESRRRRRARRRLGEGRA